jgi:hypothetical protein
MLAKCSSASCSASFLRLQEGKLFLLDSERMNDATRLPRSEYFWLCPRCASQMTLRLAENQSVVTVPLPERTRRVSADEAAAAGERKAGLYLRSVNFAMIDRDVA